MHPDDDDNIDYSTRGPRFVNFLLFYIAFWAAVLWLCLAGGK